jgi:SAM-dependent methyltransferase
MSEKQEHTHSHGLFEPLLSKLRAHQANRLIPDGLRNGRVLDIGCGYTAYFLAHTSFVEKFGIDRTQPAVPPESISWYTLDLGAEPYLPFSDGFFSAITMLAVVEHLDPKKLSTLLRETHRALKPGGILIITTPAAWSDGLLRVLAKLNVVNAELFAEHIYAYTLPLLGWYFGVAGFELRNLKFGYFECGLNLWATAQREDMPSAK